MRIPIALRLALRELRGGLAGFRIFLACLALGVAAIAAVGSVRMAIEEGLSREAASILGGDAQIEFTYRFADRAERDWMAEKATEISGLVDFRSMAAFDDADGETQRALVQVKAVDGAYPLYGRVELAGDGSLAEALATRDGLPGLVAQRILIDRFGLEPGDVLRLGTQDFRLSDELLVEPDAAASGFGLGPRVIVLLEDLEGSGLLSEGSLFDSSYRLRLPPEADLAALREEARARFADTGLQWRDRRNGAPGLSRFVDRLAAFLVLIGLAGLAVGGVGVSAAVRAHLEGKTETIATLKTLGATGGTVFAVYLAQIGLLSLAGIALGLVLGAGAPLLAAPLIEARLPVPAAFGLYARPLAEAAAYGALTALIFSIWPLARARDIRAAELFRDLTAARRAWPAPRFVAATLALAGLLVGLATWLSGAPELALGTAGGVIGALLLLLLAARGLGRLARRLARSRLARGRPALRWALAALGGPSGETASVVLSLGLGLSVLAAVGQIDSNLRGLITRDLPARAPSYFFVDIQNDQLEGFLETARAEPGVTAVETAPMLRGIITRINGKPAREVAGGHWTLNGDRGVTYAATPPPGTVITEGAWWPEDHAGPPLMSFAEEEGRELGLRLGDTLTVNILGRDLTATILNFREVKFETMGINFLMTVDPAALAGAPHTHIATVYAEPEAEAPLLRALAEAYPNITAVRVREAIEKVASSLEGLGAATRWGASATLLTGLVVLVGAAAAGVRRRVFESAVLKTLGAGRGRILASFALRAALIGTAAGAVAILAGGIAGWAVMVLVMDGSFRFEPLSALAIVAGGALASLLAGLAFALGPLSARPARVLRARE
ncbi:MAG TPA: drug:proton antiporter [Amaricoccus sp.]|uniref:ABC transporter permease n=1 Tax=Amaricoccus sp. TaxID=1872485 RepID=UPI002BE8ECCB|nr:FtsX-like permease family protein [Amaricoccus sp.]HMQ92941.1 drug:proton antiporter [Amaricoccus sp.]HMR52467.1 drug:proton antiporter [Amaricoccus sp.]HMR59394.1 drug:proton antiporter [Amaricoccus sp.]HMT99377.1 drug:proton antiporter [Amaricoccus sp.]